MTKNHQVSVVNDAEIIAVRLHLMSLKQPPYLYVTRFRLHGHRYVFRFMVILSLIFLRSVWPNFGVPIIKNLKRVVGVPVPVQVPS
jgi:hypothetical protein